MEYNTKDHIIELINNEINPGLASHGGYVELNEVGRHEDSLVIILDFMGGCHGAPSSVSYTLRSIEFLLREELNAPTLQVKSSAELQ